MATKFEIKAKEMIKEYNQKYVKNHREADSATNKTMIDLFTMLMAINTRRPNPLYQGMALWINENVR